MDIAIIVSIVTGVCGIAASILALLGSLRKSGLDDSAARRADLSHQAEQIQKGMQEMLRLQEHYYKGRIEDLEQDLKEAKDRITQLENERGK